ncbi:hypothetical protein THAOC_04052 [Thalassiosira oceanica]|uniref:Uncharacterized protein n=1 Tax=Thalassiosira oceanica TaxID=159749 RepID=K0TK17_THAOC|nr:hypothetical protein THAOC_04052 [Thalassiosira oceanica]|eukprot:EJK74281.1 hypothetical protein THAOC_04052 [Thalassiosira oceanica]
METPQNAPSRGTSAQDESLIVQDGPTAPASGEEAYNLSPGRRTHGGAALSASPGHGRSTSGGTAGGLTTFEGSTYQLLPDTPDRSAAVRGVLGLLDDILLLEQLEPFSALVAALFDELPSDESPRLLPSPRALFGGLPLDESLAASTFVAALFDELPSDELRSPLRDPSSSDPLSSSGTEALFPISFSLCCLSVRLRLLGAIWSLGTGSTDRDRMEVGGGALGVLDLAAPLDANRGRVRTDGRPTNCRTTDTTDGAGGAGPDNDNPTQSDAELRYFRTVSPL